MRKYRITALLLVLCIVFSFCVSASAASGTCEIFYFNDAPDSLGPGGSAGIQSYLGNLGYTANRYANTLAYYVRRTMDSDKVFAIVAHGAPGYVVCAQTTKMSANAVPSDNDCYSLAAWFSSGSLSSMKFAYYGACKSARGSSTYGNLLDYTTSTLGAQSALGFYEDVNDDCATHFESTLFFFLSGGNTITSSASSALVSTYNNYGTYGSVDSYRIYGSAYTTIS